MIRFIHLIKRKDDVTVEDFRKFWDGPDLNAMLDKAMNYTLTASYKKNLTLDIPINTQLQFERYSKQPFDAILEIILQSGQELEALEGNEEFNQMMSEMFDLQSHFIDFHESRRFFTEYNEDYTG